MIMKCSDMRCPIGIHYVDVMHNGHRDQKWRSWRILITYVVRPLLNAEWRQESSETEMIAKPIRHIPPWWGSLKKLKLITGQSRHHNQSNTDREVQSWRPHKTSILITCFTPGYSEGCGRCQGVKHAGRRLVLCLSQHIRSPIYRLCPSVFAWVWNQECFR